ncbi:hypothetical protein F511_07521 [Dorcoceras hygrometricum]|uniref:Uncharacterized protein n=1 Tax=Dorcoceras hygrometricum TaxID=472368 RepID=A0A2Z7B3K0_9LAMI|nr:hypothetical protein F511_07521 [Dorcoceras hygrometricum]
MSLTVWPAHVIRPIRNQCSPDNTLPRLIITSAREVARSSRRSLDEMMVQHDKLMMELEDVRGVSDVEKRSLTDKLATSEASVTRLQEEMKKMKEELEATWEKEERRFPQVFRAEHPASFLSVLKALEDLPEEGEVESSSSPKK